MPDTHILSNLFLVRTDRRAATAPHGTSTRRRWIVRPCDGIVHTLVTTLAFLLDIAGNRAQRWRSVG